RNGRSSSTSGNLIDSVFVSFLGAGDLVAGGFFFSKTTPSPAWPLSHTTLCPVAALVLLLHRINPTMIATCAAPIRATLLQNRKFFGIAYLVSARVAMPTFIMPARC